MVTGILSVKEPTNVKPTAECSLLHDSNDRGSSYSKSFIKSEHAGMENVGEENAGNLGRGRPKKKKI